MGARGGCMRRSFIFACASLCGIGLESVDRGPRFAKSGSFPSAPERLGEVIRDRYNPSAGRQVSGGPHKWTFSRSVIA